MVGGFGIKDLTGFLPRTVTQLLGGPASGKTNLCLAACVKTARKGKKVIFIDTEGSFSYERFRQLAGKDSDRLLKKIIVAEPADFDEQKIAIGKLEDLMRENDVGLVAVDSLVSLYRLEMGGEDRQAANKELSKQLSKLMKVAKKHKIPVVITNQVYSKFTKDGSEGDIVPVGKDMLRYWSKVIIYLFKDGSRRTATLMRHSHKPEGSQVAFKISYGSIEEVGAAARAKAASKRDRTE